MNVVAADAGGLRAAIAAINAGHPIVVPTDTVYGLAVRAGDPDALDLVFALKRRPAERSIAVLVSGLQQASEIADITDVEQRVAGAFWPGALTLVMQRRDDVHSSIGRDDGTVGVRCPASEFVRQLAEAVGPLATTSANLSGQSTPVDAVDAAAALDGPVAVVVDDGPCEGFASTVARLHYDGTATVFRAGPISAADLTTA